MRYFGGKNQAGTYQRIINLIPRHDVFIEGFCGSAPITRLKRPAALTYCIDRAALDLTLPGGAVFIRADVMEFLECYQWRGGEMVYLDPPYLHETRRSGHSYPYELTKRDHGRLLGIAKDAPCDVMISGYPSRLYERELAGWGREEFKVMTRGHTVATEVLWFNYARPTALHDVTYVGKDFRERLRIRRKRDRWRARLAKLPALERAVLFEALSEAMGMARPLASDMTLSDRHGS